MTLGEAIREVWEFTGEPSDLDPFDPATPNDKSITNILTTSYGFERIRNVIQRGLEAVVSYKTGRRYWRFQETKEIRNLTGRNFNTYTITAVSDNVITVSHADSPEISDELIGLEVVDSTAGVRDVIVSAVDNGGTEYLLTTLNGNVTAASVGNNLNFYSNAVPLGSGVFQVFKAFDPVNEVVLEYLDKMVGDFKQSTSESGSQPSSFYRYGNSLILDVYFRPSDVLQVEYFKIPDLTTEPTEELPLSAQWHYAIIWYAIYLIQFRAQEPETTAQAFANFQNFMQTTKTQSDVRGERTEYYPGSISGIN